MRVYPVIIDSQPEYLRRGSLLFAPLGTGTVLETVLSSLEGVTGNAPAVIAPPQHDASYADALRAIAPGATVIRSPEDLEETFVGSELSDAFLIVDPRCFPVRSENLASLMDAYASETRLAHHLVAFDVPAAGTKERVTFDRHGQVRGINRHYEQATWPFIAGLSACVLPWASGILTEGLRSRSLADLRHALAKRGVPSRDIAIAGPALNLEHETGILTGNELLTLAAAQGASDGGTIGPRMIGTGQSIDPTARLIGPIIVHANATIEQNATIVGPAVLGPSACVHRDAVVAHSIVGQDSIVPAGRILRDQTWFERLDGDEKGGGRVSRRPIGYPERLSRISASAAGPSQLHDPAVPSLERHLALKRAFDFVVAAVSLAVLLPLLALIAAAVWIESRGPVFYGDRREGLAGRVFGCWKFRTMFTGAHLAQRHLQALDQTDGPHFKLDRDPRVTRVGALLRTLNLDELPQLYNVLVGDMSLVGPRPSPFRENQICVPWREARLSVRPGITGFWQVCRHDRALGDFHQWIEYDLLYVQHLSFWLDLKILAATVLTLGGKATHVPESWLLGRTPAVGAITQESLRLTSRVEAASF
jgi:lipopolysaccharide/colanic/teichoic acid biosynthesis glycosyltransferase